MNKQILILTSYSDISVFEVVKFIPKEYNPRIINNIDISNLDFKISIELKNKKLIFSGIDGLWFRKMPNFSEPKNEIENYLYSEFKEFLGLIKCNSHLAKDIYILGSSKYEFGDPNKIRILLLASKHGLNIPETLITNDNESLSEFCNKFNEVVTKPIRSTEFFIDNSRKYSLDTYTKKLKRNSIKYSLDHPNKFQKFIKKSFEIRVLFIGEEFYSAATIERRKKIDIRKGSFQESRTIPFLLDVSIKEKLLNLIRENGYNTCSIDLLYSDSEYYFLEINPFGIYDMVSIPCNYNLNSKIANYLVNQIDQM